MSGNMAAGLSRALKLKDDVDEEQPVRGETIRLGGIKERNGEGGGGGKRVRWE